MCPSAADSPTLAVMFHRWSCLASKITTSESLTEWSPIEVMWISILTGARAGVVPGSVTVTGMLVRLPALKDTMSLENETSTPGSSVMFSSRRIP